MKTNSLLMCRLVAFALSVTFTFYLQAQDINRVTENDYHRNRDRKTLHIPDIQGYQTLKGDFHTHTVFSDGSVWPEIRIMEAWKEGLDVIAITDHLEYLPHKENLVFDHNTSYELARELALEQNILLVRGTEITRSMPPGHLNALFLEDANPVLHENPRKQLEEAVSQGAFIIWNHPGWKSQQPDTTIWWELHTEFLEDGLIHGVEVSNSGEWYPVALDWCRDRELAVFANSDVHAPIDLQYDLSQPYSHRPITLVFAEQRTIEGVKEALFERRTVGFLGDQLMGPEDLIVSLFNASVRIKPPFHESEEDGLKLIRM